MTSHVGEVFGSLTIIADLEQYQYGGKMLSRVRCRCACGNEITRNYSQLVSKMYSSCGCKGDGKLANSLCRHCKHFERDKNIYRCKKQDKIVGSIELSRQSCPDYVIGRLDHSLKKEHSSLPCLKCGEPVYYRTSHYEAPVYCERCSKVYGRRDREAIEHMNTEGMIRLVQEIFKRAKDDYVDGELAVRLNQKNAETASRYRDEAEWFFHSKWAKMLSMNDDFDANTIFRFMDNEIERKWANVNREHTRGIDEGDWY